MTDQEVTSKYSLGDVTGLGRYKKTARVRSLFEHFLPNLPTKARVLEIGPGRGEFASECIARQFDYVGIEPSDELRKQLEARNIAVVGGSAPPIPFDNNSFDLVHSYDLIEHLSTYPEAVDLSSEAFRVLKPGGYISIVAPNYLTIGDLFFRYEYQHSFVTTPGRLTFLLNDCGFELVRKRCFLHFLSPRLNWIDRLLVRPLIFFAKNPVIESLIVALTSEQFLFRIHKNVYDHVGVLGRKLPHDQTM